MPIKREPSPFARLGCLCVADEFEPPPPFAATAAVAAAAAAAAPPQRTPLSVGSEEGRKGKDADESELELELELWGSSAGTPAQGGWFQRLASAWK